MHAPILILALLSVATLARTNGALAEEIKIGSKKFTESVILGELLAQLAEHAGETSTHRKELGGTQIVWKSLLSGEVDAYVEYTGTLQREILAKLQLSSESEIGPALRKQGVEMAPALGFNNTYTLAMQKERAQTLGIEKVSDLAHHPNLVFGFGNEFMQRRDGWPGLRREYGLPQTRVSGMDHALAYQGLVSGKIDLVDAYSTDAEIAAYDLRPLEDDRSYFPSYRAVVLYRRDLHDRSPHVAKALRSLSGLLSDETMTQLNARAKIDRIPEARIAADFLQEKLNLHTRVVDETSLDRFVANTRSHLFLVLVSLFAAILFALPLGIAAAKFERLGQVILAVVGIVQTIPTLALLVFMIPLIGIGAPAAMVALFLYSLLPIVRSTHAGLKSLSTGLVESAIAIGLPPRARLLAIELPMAARSILSGIKTAAVINVGTATLGALIGAGGYGQPILTGIRLDDVGLILEGAVPAALLALLVQAGFDVAERFFVPRGLRLDARDS
ncbi:MAG: glycine betaine ABC transporter substrate-binding protein [Planctomycetota bacterium]